MSSPIPLSAPDGTVYAYACGRCRRVWASGHSTAEVQDVAEMADRYREETERCCVCSECGSEVDDDARGDRTCTRCHEETMARHRAHREAHHAALAARGVRVCPECYDLCDGCGVCGGTGEVPL